MLLLNQSFPSLPQDGGLCKIFSGVFSLRGRWSDLQRLQRQADDPVGHQKPLRGEMPSGLRPAGVPGLAAPLQHRLHGGEGGAAPAGELLPGDTLGGPQSQQQVLPEPLQGADCLPLRKELPPAEGLQVPGEGPASALRM